MQCIRDSPDFSPDDALTIAHIDNHQASVESRILGLDKLSIFEECCHLGAYMSACAICCKVWLGSTIPVSKSVTYSLLRCSCPPAYVLEDC